MAHTCVVLHCWTILYRNATQTNKGQQLEARTTNNDIDGLLKRKGSKTVPIYIYIRPQPVR